MAQLVLIQTSALLKTVAVSIIASTQLEATGAHVIQAMSCKPMGRAVKMWMNVKEQILSMDAKEAALTL